MSPILENIFFKSGYHLIRNWYMHGFRKPYWVSESLLAVYKLPIHLINLLFPFSIFFLSADTFSLFFWQPTSSMQHGVCTSVRENMKNELANQSSHTGEQKLQLCESLLQKEQPEISCATSISTTQPMSHKSINYNAPMLQIVQFLFQVLYQIPWILRGWLIAQKILKPLLFWK